MSKLIDTLHLPSGLRGLTKEQLEQVSDELRKELINTISESGGHFASSLGCTELSVVLHYLFATPDDKLLWDVGHQGYIHKMLTGRREDLPKIRKKGGISGFLRRDESEYDTFGAGHAGTSISAGLGIAVALARTNPSRFVVPIIGDGAMTCGMAFEALNHAGELGLSNLIVVLNDNEMSISPNVGAHRWLFSRALTSKPSNMARSQIKSLYNMGYMPETVYKMFDRAQTAAQGFFSGPAMLFESFRFRYIGPINGHSISDLIDAFEHAKEQTVPVLLHVRTAKGQGYSHAEEDPIKWHAVKPFDPANGKPLSSSSPTAPTYTKVFSQTLLHLAKEDKRIVGITAAMAEGTGLDLLRKELPESFFDVAICEQHAVTFAAGLSCEGMKPVCAIYSTFLQRAYDQIIHDVCVQNLPVVFALDRAGVVGNDGETHQGQFDISFLRCIPNLVLMVPSDENQLQHMLFSALEYDIPTALRYPRGNGQGVKLDESLQVIPCGKSRVMRRGHDALFLGVGPMLYDALKAAEILSNRGIECTVIDMRFVKPLDSEILMAELGEYPIVCTYEDNALQGGFGSAILEFAQTNGIPLTHTFQRFGLGDHFIAHASQEEQLFEEGCSTEHFENFVSSHCSKKKNCSTSLG
jgi:1-deoxy-D-xylulose-5-phosphate synthase